MELNVLIVDDEKFLRRIIKNLLGKIEYPVNFIEAEDGAPAIEQLKRGIIDLVFLDIYMPEVDGIEVLRFIRTNTATANLPVIIVSSATVNDVRKAYRLGIEYLIVKPFDPKDLTSQMSAIIHDILLKKGRIRDSFSKLLLVDNDSAYRGYFCEMLRSGHTIYTASSAEEGASMYFQHRDIEAVFVSQAIPGGWHEVEMKVRGRKSIPPPEIYLLTDSDSEQRVPPTMNGILKKSLETKEFLDVFVDDFLQQKDKHGLLVLEIVKDQLSLEFRESVPRSMVKLLGDDQPFELDPELDIVPEVQAVVLLEDSTKTFSLAVSLSGQSHHIVKLAQRVQPEGADGKKPLTKEVLKHIITVIAEDVCEYVQELGVAAMSTEAVVSGSLDNPLTYDWTTRFSFQGGGGDVVFSAAIGLIGSKISSEYV